MNIDTSHQRIKQKLSFNFNINSGVQGLILWNMSTAGKHMLSRTDQICSLRIKMLLNSKRIKGNHTNYSLRSKSIFTDIFNESLTTMSYFVCFSALIITFIKMNRSFTQLFSSSVSSILRFVQETRCYLRCTVGVISATNVINDGL